MLPYSWVYRLTIVWLTYNQLRRIAQFQVAVKLGVDPRCGSGLCILQCIYSEDHTEGEAAIQTCLFHGRSLKQKIKSNYPTHFKSLLMLWVLTSHWPKQVAWPRQSNGMEECTLPSLERDMWKFSKHKHKHKLLHMACLDSIDYKELER